MSNYRNNGARPATSPVEPTEATQPTDLGSDDEGMGHRVDEGYDDPIERIRAKRKREEAMKSIPEAKRMKINTAKVGEPTVLIVIHNLGHWELRTDQFVCK